MHALILVWDVFLRALPLMLRFCLAHVTIGTEAAGIWIPHIIQPGACRDFAPCHPGCAVDLHLPALAFGYAGWYAERKGAGCMELARMLDHCAMQGCDNAVPVV